MLVPVCVMTLPIFAKVGPYTLHPRTAAGMYFNIRLENDSQKTCLIFKTGPVPEGLREYLCAR